MSGIAIITGAGSGIGRAVARDLAAHGWRVALTGRRAAALEETAEGRSETLIHPADLTDSAQVDALFAATVARWGRWTCCSTMRGSFRPQCRSRN